MASLSATLRFDADDLDLSRVTVAVWDDRFGWPPRVSINFAAIGLTVQASHDVGPADLSALLRSLADRVDDEADAYRKTTPAPPPTGGGERDA